MFGIRIAAVVLALTAPLLTRQRPSQSALKLQVQDQSGARVPSALIQIRSQGPNTSLDARTGQAGEVTVSPDPGTYVRLELGREGGISVEPDVVNMEIEHPMPDQTIAELPLELVMLPTRKLRHRWAR